MTENSEHGRYRTTVSADWHAIDPDLVLEQLQADVNGLATDEAIRRLETFGPNQIAEETSKSAFAVFISQFRSPLIYILLFAAVATIGLREYIDSAVIAAVLLLNAVIGFTQERQAERSIQALKQLVAPRAHVLRDGREREIESADVVPGDIVLIESGTRIPADIRIITSTALNVDESLLTGESVTVQKRTDAVAADADLADRTSLAFAGTTVASGRGRGVVIATGALTSLGEIAEQVRGHEEIETPLQARMDRFAKIVGASVLGSTGVAFILGLIRGIEVTEMFMVGVGLAVAAVPEGLPVVFTITLAIGVHRMARRNAIIRRLPAVETLGSASVIGSDKTGTLTENRMTVQKIWTPDGAFSLSNSDAPSVFRNEQDISGIDLERHRSIYKTFITGVLTNEAEIYSGDNGETVQGDPTELALLVSAAQAGLDPAGLRTEHGVVDEIPFEPDLQYSASFRNVNGRKILFVKGAPERIVAMSSFELKDGDKQQLDGDGALDAADQMARHGLRVLAMAYREYVADSELPNGAPEPEQLVFVGLQGMLDPPRHGVHDAIRGCQDAGLRVVMITGDHAATGHAIGRQLGIADENSAVLTGRDLDRMSDDELDEQLQNVSIFARVSPAHKLRVVQTLQRHDHVVGVTGDGVNDAPALKAADIGIAMGKSGTDVAREASDMVLTDDNFVSIYRAVEQGRVTFDNVRKVTFFLISTGVASVLTILAALVIGWPIPFVPAQLLWLNLVTKGLQDVALAFEPGEPDVLKRAPRDRYEGIISGLLWERTVITGLTMAVGTLAMFWWALDQGGGLIQAQTVALTTLVVFQMFHVGNSRSDYRSAFRMSPFSNRYLLPATGAAFIVHVAALYLAPTQFVLRVEPIAFDSWVRIVFVALSIIAVVEIHKVFRRPTYGSR